jgi:hemerythrin-like domain-containing protein
MFLNMRVLQFEQGRVRDRFAHHDPLSFLRGRTERVLIWAKHPVWEDRGGELIWVNRCRPCGPTMGERYRAAAHRAEAMQSIRIIQDEHRSLGAVLHGMLYLVHEIRDRGAKPHFDLLGAMLYYIDTVPERFHHPKEEQYLFWLLRIRHPSAAPLLDRLKIQHQQSAEQVRTLEQALVHYQQGGPSEFATFLAAVEAFVAFQREHMRIEEDEVLPLAIAHLTAGDWEAIDAAFLSHTDPLLGVDAGAKHATLFGRIVDLAPPAVGTGPLRR